MINDKGETPITVMSGFLPKAQTQGFYKFNLINSAHLKKMSPKLSNKYSFNLGKISLHVLKQYDSTFVKPLFEKHMTTKSGTIVQPELLQTIVRPS